MRLVGAATLVTQMGMLLAITVDPLPAAHPIYAREPEALRASKEPVSRGDVVCGPRCVKFVLSRYGIEEELIKLVREIQGVDFDHGSTMKSLEESIQARGIHTCALQLSATSLLNWPYPVIVHLNGDEGSEIGHFVVQVPSSSPSRVEVFAGLLGLQEGPEDKLARRRSGAVLLTSPTEILNPEMAVQIRERPFALLMWPGIVLVTVAVFLSLSRFGHRLARSPNLVPLQKGDEVCGELH